MARPLVVGRRGQGDDAPAARGDRRGSRRGALRARRRRERPAPRAARDAGGPRDRRRRHRRPRRARNRLRTRSPQEVRSWQPLERSSAGNAGRRELAAADRRHVQPVRRSLLRRERLARYLEAKRGAPIVLVGEAAGYRGARVSGSRSPPSASSPARGPAEATATIVHRVLAELGLEDDVLLWNVVPTHPHEPDARIEPAADARRGRRASPFLDALARGRRVVAVGRLAEEVTGAPYVRHPSHGGASAFRGALETPAPECYDSAPAARLSALLRIRMKTYNAKPGEVDSPLVRRRRRGPDPRPPRDPDRRHAARQGQAAVHAARRHGRLRRRRERREDRGHRQQARPEDVPPPLRLSGRAAEPAAARAARPAADRGAPQGGQGHAPAQPARARTDQRSSRSTPAPSIRTRLRRQPLLK